MGILTFLLTIGPFFRAGSGPKGHYSEFKMHLGGFGVRGSVAGRGDCNTWNKRVVQAASLYRGLEVHFSLGVPKPGCFKPGCLQFYLEAIFCALLHSVAPRRLPPLQLFRSFVLSFVFGITDPWWRAEPVTSVSCILCPCLLLRQEARKAPKNRSLYPCRT